MAIEFDKDEHILFEVRKHWFVLAKETTLGFLAFMAPAIFYAIFSVLPIEINTPGDGIVLFLFTYCLWLIIVWMFLFVFWTDYYLDVWIVTNKKLVDVEQRGLFNREIATMQLSKIQDVTSEQKGLMPSILGFGDLHVQTAGREKEFVIRSVKDPNVLRKQLNDALVKYQEGKVT